MSDIITKAVEVLNKKISGFDSTAKFVVEGEGAIMIDENGAREGDGPAEATLTASRETFEGILDGSVNPTSAFMSGKLKLDGSMPTAMKLASAL